MHAEYDRAFAGYDMVQIYPVHDGALADVFDHSRTLRKFD
jgi:hypothetical protein